MLARCGDLEGALGVWLALDVIEIGFTVACGCCIERGRRLGFERAAIEQVRTDFEEGLRGQHDGVADEGCLDRTCCRKHERTFVAGRFQRHRECAADRAQLARNTQFAREFVLAQPVHRYLSCRSEDADRNRQVEAAGRLR